MFKYLVVANSLVFIFTGIFSAERAFGQKHFLSNFGCQFVYCGHRVPLYCIYVRWNCWRERGEGSNASAVFIPSCTSVII